MALTISIPEQPLCNCCNAARLTCWGEVAAGSARPWVGIESWVGGGTRFIPIKTTVSAETFAEAPSHGGEGRALPGGAGRSTNI